jgi:hypothetical protein
MSNTAETTLKQFWRFRFVSVSHCVDAKTEIKRKRIYFSPMMTV